MSDKLVGRSRAKSMGQRVAIAASIRPKDFIPITPAIAEPSTGESMGQSAEKMAKINHIAREDQGQFALRSHRLASVGLEDGRLTAEIGPLSIPPRFQDVLTAHTGARRYTSIEPAR